MALAFMPLSDEETKTGSQMLARCCAHHVGVVEGVGARGDVTGWEYVCLKCSRVSAVGALVIVRWVNVAWVVSGHCGDVLVWSLTVCCPTVSRVWTAKWIFWNDGCSTD